MKCDVVIVGAGPSGIFTAMELLHLGSKLDIVILDQGLPVDKRQCPKHTTNKCMKCTPCRITTGFSGAGAFSDGKLSLSYEVGGTLPDLIGAEETQALIDYTDKIYLDFGADTKIEGVGNEEKIKEIRRRAIQSGLKLVDCPIRHLGTENTQKIYHKIQQHLLDNGVKILFQTECKDLLVENGICSGILYVKEGSEAIKKIEAKRTIVSVGRAGADWLENMCRAHDIAHKPSTVDIGVRVEVRNEIMEEINEILYESKLIGYPEPFKNKVRTFCQNPGGFVSQENYENNLAVVNGHSYKSFKSDNTNLSILCSFNFSEPFGEPIEYAQYIGRLVNMLGDGNILVQRYGDILDGKRTWPEELKRSNVRPTLPDAVAGDICSALPYRTMMNILSFIKAVDHIVPGFASTETLLYAPEIKLYSNRIQMDTALNTNIKRLHCLGDGSGWTRGLMMSSSMGVLMARKLNEAS